MATVTPSPEFLAAIEACFSKLSREPDFDTAELKAWDTSDTLLLATAQHDIESSRPGTLAIIGDRHGALTLGAARVCGATQIRVHQDPLLAERALQQNAARAALSGSYTAHGLDATLLRGATVVLLQLPRSIAQLTEIVAAIQRWAAPEVRVYAGGRVKHMSLRMNEVLANSFVRVQAGLGWRKSRVLSASQLKRAGDEAASTDELCAPQWGSDPELSFQLAAFGATFGGATLDHGSRLLLAELRRGHRAPRRILDLGCGNGVLAVAAALFWPEAEVCASDQSRAAVAATRETARAAGVADRVRVVRADACEALAARWADLVLLNPPFHTGAVVHTGVAHRLIRACGSVLAPGGELLVVFNSSLRYQSVIAAAVGPVRQCDRDRIFTVVSARRPSEQ